jgi:hypothetical protein
VREENGLMMRKNIILVVRPLWVQVLTGKVSAGLILSEGSRE